MKKILFLCTQNACRSQMAEGLINHELKGRVQAFSAGTAPAHVNPMAIDVLEEIGMDISHHQSKHLDEFSGETFDLVVTLCADAAKNCPFVTGMGPVEHFGFDDPANAKGNEDERLSIFRKVRDEMKGRLVPFIKTRLHIQE